MKKVVSIRIDEDFVDIIEKYVILYRHVMGFNLKKSDVVEGCILQGFENYLQNFNFITNSVIEKSNGDKFNVTSDIKKSIDELNVLYNTYMYNHVYKDDND